MKPIRKRVEVVIYHPELQQVLVAHWKKPDGITYVFPGGGIESNESTAAAAYKECLEEVGIAVTNVSTLHRGPITPIEAEEHATELLYSGSQTIYVLGRFLRRDYVKHNCEGDAMTYEWQDILAAGALVRDGSADGEHRAQALRNAVTLRASYMDVFE